MPTMQRPRSKTVRAERATIVFPVIDHNEALLKATACSLPLFRSVRTAAAFEDDTKRFDSMTMLDALQISTYVFGQ